MDSTYAADVLHEASEAADPEEILEVPKCDEWHAATKDLHGHLSDDDGNYPATPEERAIDGYCIHGPGAEVPPPARIQAQIVHEDPKVVHFTDFLSPEEVDHLLYLCEGRWERSKVSKGKASDLHGPEAGKGNPSAYGEEGVGETRTSQSVHLGFDESYVLERIAARVATVAKVGIDHVEPLVALKYEKGEFFAMHHDGSMRIATVFVYFNGMESDEGGETYFPRLGFKVQPAACTALLWYNCLDSGAADYRLLHEAKPVDRGIKYAMNCFVNVQPQRDASNIILLHAPSNGAREYGQVFYGT